jgi:hypothetical protein
MGDLVNLRRFRKARARDGEARQAEVNRIAFGRSKVERLLTRAERDLAERRIDGHLIVVDELPAEPAPDEYGA